MKKIFLPFVIILVSSVASFSQTTKQKIDQLKKDPETANPQDAAHKAAKADALLIDKKNIADTTQPKTIPKGFLRNNITKKKIGLSI